MPYLILVFGVIVALYAFTRFFIKANPQQIKTLLSLISLSIYILILFFFAATGRILIAIGLVVLSIPFLIAHLKGKAKNKDDQNDKNGQS